MATIRRRAQAINSSVSEPIRITVRSVNNVTRVSASTADWYTLNNQIESNSERISDLETRTDSLEETLSSFGENAAKVIEKADQLGYLLDVDLLTFDEIGA